MELENREATLEKESQEPNMYILELERNRKVSAHELLKSQHAGLVSENEKNPKRLSKKFSKEDILGKNQYKRFPGKTMASGTVKTMREEATCPICLELMTEPVMIDCGHIYCRSCILENLENQQQKSPSRRNFLCPICRAKFQRESIRPSKQLESIINTIKKMEQEHLCEKHGEKLSLFCRYDAQLICWCCERTPQHERHSTVLVADACQSYKSEVLSKEECIKYRFKFFHMILHMEEESYLWRLKNEEEQVLKRLQESEAQLEKQSQELNKHILELERRCQGSAQELLQDVRDTLDRIYAMKLNAPENVSLDIHTMPDVDSIFCELIKLFETDYVKVTLDPDTAHNDLLVEKNEIMVTGGRPQVKPDTPARFKDLPCVLGCEAFTSGKHYLGMFYISGPMWDVGVCLENVSRDNDKTRDPESGFWAIRHCENDNSVALTSPLTPLYLQQAICFIGVFLDYEAGLVSFYNLETCSHIFTFPKASFSEPIRPYFYISENSYLDINDPYL
ncbi:E3 ubiquitin-protein ligase TRIM38-like [Sorex araneus]|uniref:E3 ubiquitin-protein ligase TRIM38-like n=1 Tax=Sorex araneus TaxID=42254 RepID=UPI002433F6B9|nr:E3 ubiquitin-protein ligase TRIM38-like [Sorex araneus]